MAKETKNNESGNSQFTFVFSKINYTIMSVGIVLLALGYIFLSGGGSDDPNVFNPDMFNGQRLYLAPILIVLGLVAEIVAIMYNGKNKEK